MASDQAPPLPTGEPGPQPDAKSWKWDSHLEPPSGRRIRCSRGSEPLLSLSSESTRRVMRSTGRKAPEERGITLALGVMLLARWESPLWRSIWPLPMAPSEAQRAADAIALAGAGAFRDFPGPTRRPTRRGTRRSGSATEHGASRDASMGASPTATRKLMAWGKVTTSCQTGQVTLNVVPGQPEGQGLGKPAGVSTFFGGLLGCPTVVRRWRPHGRLARGRP